MRSVRFFLVIVFLSFRVSAQQDYRIYHKLINNAEKCFFLESNIDSAYKYYDSAFAIFDFSFAKDCNMAAQIAYYNSSERYVAYLVKGFENGLTLEHLRLSPIFASLVKDSISFKKKFPTYSKLRRTYLKRINVGLLTKTIEICARDQSQKQHADSVYAPILYSAIHAFETMFKALGFPGEKLIGLSQKNIMKELGYTKHDYNDYPWGHNFDSDDEYIAQTSILPLLVHQRCIYQMFAKYWDKLIVSGQIHPRQVAMLHDLAYQLAYLPHAVADMYKCYYDRPYGIYKIDCSIDYSIINTSRYTIDSMRQAIGINTLAADSAQRSFVDAHQFKSTLGLFEYW